MLWPICQTTNVRASSHPPQRHGADRRLTACGRWGAGGRYRRGTRGPAQCPAADRGRLRAVDPGDRAVAAGAPARPAGAGLRLAAISCPLDPKVCSADAACGGRCMKKFVAAVALLLLAAACSSGMTSLGRRVRQGAEQIRAWPRSISCATPRPRAVPDQPVDWPAADGQSRRPHLDALRPAAGSTSGAFGSQSSTELIITVAPGQTRFIQIESNGTGADLIEVFPRDGRRIVRGASMSGDERRF